MEEKDNRSTRGLSLHSTLSKKGSLYTDNVSGLNNLIKVLKPQAKKNCLQVKELYNKFSSFISNIEEKVGKKLENKGDSIVSAYKNQIDKLKHRVHNLTNLEQTEETKFNENNKLYDQMIALEWFKNQTKQLASKLMANENEYKALAKTIASYKDEITFLESQIKKKDKQLKSYISLFKAAKEFTDGIIATLPAPLCNADKDRYDSIFKLEKKEANLFKEASDIKKTIQFQIKTEMSRNRSFLPFTCKEPQNKQRPKEATYMDVNVNALYSSKAKEKDKTITNLRKQLLENDFKKGEYEDLFISCVESAKKESLKGKLTDSSRVRVLELLISNEAFINTIYKKIFSSSKSKSTVSIFEKSRDASVSEFSCRKYQGKVRRGKLEISS
jgi:hypothetical protein